MSNCWPYKNAGVRTYVSGSVAEWSKAPDSSVSLPEYRHIEPSGPRMWAWVRIPLLTEHFQGNSYLDILTTMMHSDKCETLKSNSSLERRYAAQVSCDGSKNKACRTACWPPGQCKCAGSVAERSKALV